MKKLLSTHKSRLTKFLSALEPQCRRAFTLAETLIVIGIIGVVAALTLPNLNHATGDKEKVTRVKKIYSSLTDAFERAQVIYGNADGWCNDLGDEDTAEIAERFAKRITEFMKVSKDCGFDEGCFSKGSRVGYDGDTNSRPNYLNHLQDSNAYMVMLSDGTSLAFWYNGICHIEVDIDGPNKGKNQSGGEIFEFFIRNNERWGDKRLPLNEVLTLSNQDYMGGPPDSYIFAAWVINNGNLDYLKANDWDDAAGAPKCDNSNIILDGVTNTSCH